MTDLLTYQLSDGVATIVMDDGKANVMSAEMISQLDAAFARARSDRAVVVLTGRGNIFSAGYDLAVFDQPQAVVAETMRAGGDLIQRILGHPHPTVAACNGHAIAQGAFTLLACDHRIGADGPFKTGLNEVAIGLTIPHYGIELARHQLASTWWRDEALRLQRDRYRGQDVAVIVDQRDDLLAGRRFRLFVGHALSACHGCGRVPTRLDALARLDNAVEQLVAGKLLPSTVRQDSV